MMANIHLLYITGIIIDNELAIAIYLIHPCKFRTYAQFFVLQIQSRLPDSVQVGVLLHDTETLMGLRSHRAN